MILCKLRIWKSYLRDKIFLKIFAQCAAKGKVLILSRNCDRFSRSIFIFSFSIYHHDTKKGDKNKYFKIQLRFWCQTKGFSVYWNKYFCRCYATRQSQKEQRDGDEKTIFSDVGFFFKNNRNHLVLGHPKHTHRMFQAPPNSFRSGSNSNVTIT